MRVSLKLDKENPDMKAIDDLRAITATNKESFQAVMPPLLMLNVWGYAMDNRY